MGDYSACIRSRVNAKLGFKNFYMYGAVEVGTGEAFSLLLPKVNTDLMNLFLKEMSMHYKDDKLTVIMDGAGWHKSKSSLLI
jgi:hypothetical protein